MDSSSSELESLVGEYEPEFESETDENDTSGEREPREDELNTTEQGSRSEDAHLMKYDAASYENEDYEGRGQYMESYLSDSSFEDGNDVGSDSDGSPGSVLSKKTLSYIQSSRSCLPAPDSASIYSSGSSKFTDVSDSEPHPADHHDVMTADCGSSVHSGERTSLPDVPSDSDSCHTHLRDVQTDPGSSSVNLHHVSASVICDNATDVHSGAAPVTPIQFSTFHGVSKASITNSASTSRESPAVNEILDDGVSAADHRDRRRQRIIKELLDTEHTYQKHLRLVIKCFQEPLQENGIIEPHVGVTLFSNLKALLSVNEELLEHLQTVGVAGAFEHMAPFLKLYSTYANNHERALATLIDLDQKNADFALWRRAQEELPEIGGLKLNALLITPVQRIPRYKLLLDELLQTTPEDDEEYGHIKDCVRQVGEVAQHINEHIRQQDNFMRMAAIQRMLAGSAAPNIVMPGRIFIKEGMLSKVSKKSGWSQERMFFLFSDMLMYAKARFMEGSGHQGNYTCCCMMPLHHCKVSRLFGRSHGDGALFTIECKEESLLLYSDPATVESWITALTTAISAVQTSRKTLKKPSSAKRPLRRPALVKMKKLQESDPLHNWGKSPTGKENSPRNLKRAFKQSRMNCLSPKESFQQADSNIKPGDLQSPRKKCFKEDKENEGFTVVKPHQKLEAKHLWCLSPTQINPRKQIGKLFSSLEKKKQRGNKKGSESPVMLLNNQLSSWDNDAEDLEEPAPVPVTEKPATLSRMPKHLRNSQKKIDKRKGNLLAKYTFDDEDSQYEKEEKDWQPAVFDHVTAASDVDDVDDTSSVLDQPSEDAAVWSAPETSECQSDVWWYQPEQLERQLSGYLTNANTTLSDDSFDYQSSGDDDTGDQSNFDGHKSEERITSDWTPASYTWDQSTVWRNPCEEDSNQELIESNDSWNLSSSGPLETEYFTTDDRFAGVPTCRTYKYNFSDEQQSSSHHYRPLSTIPEDIMESPSSPSPQKPRPPSRTNTPVKRMKEQLALAGQATQDVLKSPTTGHIPGQACTLQ